jgi:hypothetical protein
MSYTSKELTDIANNIEAYRFQRVSSKDLTSMQDAKLYRLIKDLHKISNGQYTKEAAKECIPYYNSFA